MYGIVSLILTLILCVFPPSFAQAESGDDPNSVEEKFVTIELSKLDVNDTKLELSYKIKNNTDHDVWICYDVDAYLASLNFEVYLSEDERTLLIRRRYDVPANNVEWFQWPHGKYVLLRSGQERTESLSLDIPVKSLRQFASGRATMDHAKRLVLEIGFYNEDLPGMIREVLEIVEKLNCTRLEPSEYRTAFFKHYFKGLLIAQFFGELSDFEEHTYQEGNEEIIIPYTQQYLNGEQVLRIEVDGVHIPYEEVTLADATTKGNEGKLSKSDKPDNKKHLEQNGTNEG